MTCTLSSVRLFVTPWSPWASPGQNTGVGSLFFSRGSSKPRDQNQVSRFAGDSLSAEPQGKPQMGAGSAYNLTLLPHFVKKELHNDWYLRVEIEQK